MHGDQTRLLLGSQQGSLRIILHRCHRMTTASFEKQYTRLEISYFVQIRLYCRPTPSSEWTTRICRRWILSDRVSRRMHTFRTITWLLLGDCLYKSVNRLSRECLFKTVRRLSSDCLCKTVTRLSFDWLCKIVTRLLGDCLCKTILISTKPIQDGRLSSVAIELRERADGCQIRSNDAVLLWPGVENGNWLMLMRAKNRQKPWDHSLRWKITKEDFCVYHLWSGCFPGGSSMIDVIRLGHPFVRAPGLGQDCRMRSESSRLN